MFRNYLIVFFRGLGRQRGVNIINLSGLTIGIFVSSIFFIYVFNELSFDQFHDDSDQIYRVAISGETSGQPFNFAVSPGLLAPNSMLEIPEIDRATRFSFVDDALYSYGNKKFYESDLLFADTVFMDIFKIEPLRGKQDDFLKAPFSMVLTESMAKKYFGKEDPIGKTIQWNNQYDFTITGIIKDYSPNAHFDFDFLLSFSTFSKLPEYAEHLNHWGSLSFYTYIKLYPGVSVQEIEEKLEKLMMQRFTENIVDPGAFGVIFNPYLQPITKIHLHSKIQAEIKPNSDISYIYLLSAIAFFILFLASINYMNLSTARSAGRAKEVGMRKVFGSGRSKLIVQFMGESLMTSMIALLLALVLTELALPVFNRVSGRSLPVNIFKTWEIPLLMLANGIFVGIVSGSYPAFYLSRFQPVTVLKDKVFSLSSNTRLRNILVLFQFSISVILIVATFIIYKQLLYIKSKDLGFNKENLIVIPLRNDESRNKAKIIMDAFKSLPEVISAAGSSSYPGGGIDGEGYYPEGMQGNDPWIIYNIGSSEKYIETVGIQIIDGRSFSEQFKEEKNNIIINEKLAHNLGWSEPVGKIIYRNSPATPSRDTAVAPPLRIVGVAKNFHFISLHGEIEPLIIRYLPDNFQYLLLRIDKLDPINTLDKLKKTWNRINPEFPFDFFFVEKTFDRFYQFEQKLGSIFLYLTILALLIATMGLYGLATFLAEQKTKEIGIKKSFGATTLSIAWNFSFMFIKLIILSCSIGWPLAYVISEQWLKNFQYRTEISWLEFILSGFILTFITLLTINTQTLKIAISNPSVSLRYE
ncbi:MAG: ABC transporter permease [Bacteroidales bacterium]